MIRYIDKATCYRWDKLLAELDPSEHQGGAHNPYRPGFYWFDLDNTARGPFATYGLAEENQAKERSEQ
jgi:hypothetical protein